MFISSCFNNYTLIFLKIGKLKKELSLCWDSNPQPLDFEAEEHLRIRMRKEDCL